MVNRQFQPGSAIYGILGKGSNRNPPTSRIHLKFRRLRACWRRCIGTENRCGCRVSGLLRKAWASACNTVVRRKQKHAEDGHQIGERLLVGLETEKKMKTQGAKLKASVSHHDELINELRADRQLAVEYLSAALSELDDPNNRAAGLLAMRDVAEAYGGLGAVAQEAGINRESLYRALSPKGNPTLKTILAVMKAVGMKLSVEPSNHAHA